MNAVRYGKPSMTNLPENLGKRIIGQIMASTPPDRDRLRKESNALLKTMIAERDREDAETKKEAR